MSPVAAHSRIFASTTPRADEARTQPAGVGPQGEVLVVNLDALRPRTAATPSVPPGLVKREVARRRRLSAAARRRPGGAGGCGELPTSSFG